MKLEKEVNIYRTMNWTTMSKIGVDLAISIKDLNKEELNKLNTIISKDKIKLTLEVEEPILDEAERKYLSGVIRPFRNRIISITKVESSKYERINIIYINIQLTRKEIKLPLFEKDKMYKNLELNKEYSLKDLDL